MRYKKILLIVCAGFALAGCEKSAKEEIGYGVIDNGVYSNAYFNMLIRVSEGWVVQSEVQQEELMAAGTKLISGDDDNLKKVIKASEQQTVTLFSFFKYEQGSPVSFNPNIIAVAEKVANMPGIKRGSDYHFHVKKMLENGQINYEFPGDIYSKSVSGVSFDVMPAAVNIGGMAVRQEYYAARINDYVLGIVLTYSSDEELAELNDIMNTLVFSQ